MTTKFETAVKYWKAMGRQEREAEILQMIDEYEKKWGKDWRIDDLKAQISQDSPQVTDKQNRMLKSSSDASQKTADTFCSRMSGGKPVSLGLDKDTNSRKGCGKEIEFITGQGIVMHTEICGKKSNYGEYKGQIILCDKCKARLEELKSQIQSPSSNSQNRKSGKVVPSRDKMADTSYLLRKRIIWRRWAKRHPDKAKEYNEKNKKTMETRRRKWDKVHPEKRKAQLEAEAKIEIPEGTLCSKCKINNATERHHQDYDKPLEVDLICSKCHRELHKQLRDSQDTNSPDKECFNLGIDKLNENAFRCLDVFQKARKGVKK